MMKFKAKIVDGELRLNWSLIRSYCRRWKNGTEVDVTVTKKQPSSSIRGYYFAEVLPKFARGLYYEADEYYLFHVQLKTVYFGHQPDLLKQFGLKEISVDKRGITRNIPKVFHKESVLPVSVKWEFVDWVRRKAAHEGIITDDPKPKKTGGRDG